MKFRELKVGDIFYFCSSNSEEVREKVSYRKYRDISNYGKSGDPNWIKKARGESNVQLINKQNEKNSISNSSIDTFNVSNGL